MTTLATVKIRVGDEIRHEVAEGDGPVNALDAAMRKALNGTFPNLAKLQLVDYKVRVINSAGGHGRGGAGGDREPGRARSLGHRGRERKRDRGQLDALVDSFEYKLCKDEAAGPKATVGRMDAAAVCD